MPDDLERDAAAASSTLNDCIVTSDESASISNITSVLSMHGTRLNTGSATTAAAPMALDNLPTQRRDDDRRDDAGGTRAHSNSSNSLEISTGATTHAHATSESAANSPPLEQFNPLQPVVFSSNGHHHYSNGISSDSTSISLPQMYDYNNFSTTSSLAHFSTTSTIPASMILVSALDDEPLPSNNPTPYHSEPASVLAEPQVSSHNSGQYQYYDRYPQDGNRHDHAVSDDALGTLPYAVVAASAVVWDDHLLAASTVESATAAATATILPMATAQMVEAMATVTTATPFLQVEGSSSSNSSAILQSRSEAQESSPPPSQADIETSSRNLNAINLAGTGTNEAGIMLNGSNSSSDSAEQFWKTSNPKRLLVIGVVVVVSLAMLVLLMVQLLNRVQDEPKSPFFSSSNTSNSTGGSMSSRADRIRQLIQKHSLLTAATSSAASSTDTARFNDTVSTNTSLYATNGISPWLTAEEWAIDWLIDSDPLQLSPMDNVTANFSSNSNHRILQRYALTTLWFQQVQTKVWLNKTGWLVHPDECSWLGVTCTASHLIAGAPNETSATTLENESLSFSPVIKIEIPSNNLIGTLSPELGLLTSLQVFDIRDNDVRGTLPNELSHWSHIEYLNVSSNLLTGALPSAVFSNWSHCAYLDVSSNQFSGRIPDINATGGSSLLSPNHAMRWLSLAFNLLTGSLPLSSLRQWSNLEHLNVYSNQLNGSLPDDVGSSNGGSKLTYAGFGSNVFSGTLSSSIGQWTKLRHFDVEMSTLLFGKLPASLGNWTDIEYVALYGNSFTGPLPSTLSAWSKMESFLVYGNQLSGPLPEWLGHGWPLMTWFSIGSNRFAGTLPSSIANWTQLVSFDVAANENLTGTIPEAVGTQWTSLIAMSLFGTNVTGSIPRGFCQQSNVSQIYFGYDQKQMTCDCCTVY